MSENRPIQVAVGVIFDTHGRVLIGQRTFRDRYFAQWEFPGGKLETGESAEKALVRELREELSIEVRSSKPLTTIEHKYPDRQVVLHVFLITRYRGQAIGKEGQAILWRNPSELGDINFLEGNQKLIEIIQTL